MVNAVLSGHGASVPPPVRQDALWDGFFADHYAQVPLAERVWRRAGIVTRHGVVDPRVEDVSGWGTGARMRRFLTEALPLGKEAVAACLDDAGVDAGDVDRLAVVSCTGYATPGLDILLARDLGLPPGVERVHIGHMGCYAALPGLSSVADAATARGKVSVLLCLELTSLHIQPPTRDVEQVVAHALFSDAAAAVLVAPGQRAGAGLALVDVVARTDTAQAAMMTWEVTDAGFRMRLSPDVPSVLERHIGDVVSGLLGRHGLAVGDVAGWAIHPGGPRIVDVVADRLGLSDTQVAESRQVLRDHGNCSSATVLMILERIRRTRRPRRGDPVVAVAFGPGLTLYAALLRGC